MKFDEKINVMLANGKLSVEQAQALKVSINSETATVAAHKPIPKFILWLAAAAFVVLIFSALGSGSAPQEIQNVAETINQSGKVGEMNKSMSTTMGLLIIGLPVLIWLVLSYNSLVAKEEDVLVAWSQVETTYQRRADLIPNLVSSVKAYTEHEGNTLTNIAKLRSDAEKLETEQNHAETATSGAVTKLGDEAYMDSLAKNQNAVSSQLKSLMVSVEAYPQLRASDQFSALQAELEGTENRINVARMAFNEKVGEFNSFLRRLPNSLMAGAGNFQRKAYFKADEGTDKGVKVNFDAPAVE